MLRRYFLPLIAIIVLGLVAGLGFVSHLSQRGSTGPMGIVPRKTPVPTTEPTPLPDPLTIEGIRGRSYPGSPIISEQSLGEVSNYKNSIISYQSDGFKVYALMSVPDKPKPLAGWPVIILNHGYINPSNYVTNGPEYRQFIAAFTAAGYVVIKPDFRGHGKSQGVAEGGHFSPAYAYDVLNLISSIKQDSTFNASRIGMFGHSMGGHVSLRSIVTSPDIKATVFMAAVVGSFDDIFYSWPHSPLHLDAPSQVQVIREALIQKHGDPHGNPNFWASASAINYVSAVVGAVQINQDSGDSTVPTVFSDHLNAALLAAHKPVEYHLYPGNDHQFIKNRALILQRAVAFYQAHL